MKEKVTGLFLYITEAFDTVDHAILLKKLYDCGIRGLVYKWFLRVIYQGGNDVLKSMAS